MRGRFFEVHLADFASTQLKRFAALLNCEDADLFDWVIAGSAAPEEEEHDVKRLLRVFAWRRDKSE
jgi:succinate dehydrogenase flavin-adding protein (antitoxin of CptAB toxin-antitoxin module)